MYKCAVLGEASDEQQAEWQSFIVGEFADGVAVSVSMRRINAQFHSGAPADPDSHAYTYTYTYAHADPHPHSWAFTDAWAI